MVDLAKISTTHLYLIIGVVIAILFAMFYFNHTNNTKILTEVKTLKERIDQIENMNMGLDEVEFEESDEEIPELPTKKVSIANPIEEESTDSEAAE